ncbi:2-oxoglutarate dehydrogenase complex dihydrolipoyllysine-residue succinyltransferase [Brevundimonas sp. UBA7664]|uniref:2-oxoglutarate dehydrogenase complex dihydrolipoyllysine-residue succinyltransferase n=1 Tax=Brevundimonas sp. UBA7664 TaxID=1946141 RepID=UPI0025BB7BB9|nr:2-oxoglutarate dehydrogenase complex dihydrolipoyllysine-residue succinyltransferase [Brevundimonas sp. UBA7664]
MATEIRVPTLGESVSEATIGTWFKKVGDAVKADEPLCELETDKVTIEVPAPASGVLSEIVANAGDTVEPGGLLGQIAEGASAGAAASAASAEKAAAPEKATPAAQPAPAAAPAGNMPPAPAAQKMLAENNITAGEVEGSGKRGQVLKGDVIAAVAKGVSTPSVAAEPVKVAARAPSSESDAPREERVKMTRLRQTIARRLKESQNTAAQLTTFNEVDMTNVMALRTQYKDAFEKRHGVKLGFMSFFTKAIVAALKEIPAVNAEIDGTDIIYKNHYDIGVAVGTEKGLVVPVLRDADQLSLAGIEKGIAALGKAARDGDLTLDQLQGGTFTITNGGTYGSLMSTPILNAPQSGILGMHNIVQRPMAIDGQVVIRPMMYLALSYDHRIVDGKEAVTFLVRVKELLEDPARALLDL